jgi:hypothetical protein
MGRVAPGDREGVGAASARRLGEGARAALGFAALLLAAAAIAVPVSLLVGGSDPPEVATGEVAAAGRDPGGEADPFAWSPGRRSQLESRAASGFAHVLY